MKYDEKEIGKKIKSEREKRKWTQARLGKELNISGKQISNYEKGEPIPPMGILLSLCGIFDCELGYLLGEEDYSEGSKLLTQITEYTGLNKVSIENIRKITGTKKTDFFFGYESEEFRGVLNKFLGSRGFLYFIESLRNFDKVYDDNKDIFSELKTILGLDLYEEAVKYYNSQTDYFHDPNAEKLDDKIYKAMMLIDHTIDDSHSLEYQLKVRRYDLREEFERLIDELYPK